MAGNEFEFIDWIRSILPPPRDVELGIGDDCALVSPSTDPIVLKVDSVVEGVHFQVTSPSQPGYLTPQQVGRKALLRCLSDFAAMGATPRHALVAGTLGTQHGLAFAQELIRGLVACANEFTVDLVGGETSAWGGKGGLVLSVTLVGRQEVAAVTRSGARIGDEIWVTGSLGRSLASGRHAEFIPRLGEGRFLAEFGATSMLDLSDGLESDLKQICSASKVGALIEASKLPLHGSLGAALSDGEDYELLFTLPANQGKELEAAWRFATPLTRVGEIVHLDEGLKIRNSGKVQDLEGDAWRHNI